MSEARKERRQQRRKIASLSFAIASVEVFARDISKAGGLLLGGRVWIPCAKVKYGHKFTAEKAGEAMTRKTGDSFDAYYCQQCKAWHIGHSRS